MAPQKKPVPRSRNVGRANLPQLEDEGRIVHVEGLGFDNEPSPARGPVRGKNGMRKGYTPEMHHKLLEKEAYLKTRGSVEQVAANLYEFEVSIYEKWLKAQKPDKKEVTEES